MWTPNAVIGLLCLIAAAVVPWIFPDDAGRGMGSSLTVLGGMLLGWSPAAPGLRKPDEPPRGMARIDAVAVLLACSAVVVVFALLIGNGCATAVTAKREVTLDVTPGPPCVIVVRADGAVVSTVKGPARCGVVVAP